MPLYVCRACMHSFFIDCQSLRELRITSVSKDAAIHKRNMGRIKCNSPVNFFKQHMRFPTFPPPPHKASLLSLATPPPPLKSSVAPEAGVISSSGGSDRGVLSTEGWPIRYDSCPWHIWRVRAVGECGRSIGSRRWPAAAPPLFTPALLLSLAGTGDK